MPRTNARSTTSGTERSRGAPGLGRATRFAGRARSDLKSRPALTKSGAGLSKVNGDCVEF